MHEATVSPVPWPVSPRQEGRVTEGEGRCNYSPLEECYTEKSRKMENYRPTNPARLMVSHKHKLNHNLHSYAK